MEQGRREHPRVPARLIVRFSSAKSFVEQYTSNISKGGLFLHMREPYPENTELDLAVVLPCNKRQINVRGRVVHTQLPQNGHNGGMGIQFLDMVPEAREAFEQCVNGYLDEQVDIGMDEERRRHERHQVKLTVKFTSPKAFLQQYTRDLSKGGLFIQTDKPLPQGTEVALKLHLPLTKRELDVPGRVAHIRPVGSNGEPAGIGIEFTDLTDETRGVIDAYVIMLEEKRARGRL